MKAVCSSEEGMPEAGEEGWQASAWAQMWWVKKPIIFRPGVARPEGEKLVFVWAPLCVGGGGSCIPEACMWVVPGFQEGRLLHLRGRRGDRNGEAERGEGVEGLGAGQVASTA